MKRRRRGSLQKGARSKPLSLMCLTDGWETEMNKPWIHAGRKSKRWKKIWSNNELKRKLNLRWKKLVYYSVEKLMTITILNIRIFLCWIKEKMHQSLKQSLQAKVLIALLQLHWFKVVYLLNIFYVYNNKVSDKSWKYTINFIAVT